MDMGVIRVPVIDGDPIELCSEVGFHLPSKVASKRLEIGHLSGILGRDDEAEMMPVIFASFGKGGIVGAVHLGIEHARLLAVCRDAVALQIGKMRGHRC